MMASGLTDLITDSPVTRLSKPMVAPFGAVEKVRDISPLVMVSSLVAADSSNREMYFPPLISQSFC